MIYICAICWDKTGQDENYIREIESIRSTYYYPKVDTTDILNLQYLNEKENKNSYSIKVKTSDILGGCGIYSHIEYMLKSFLFDISQIFIKNNIKYYTLVRQI